MRLNHVALVCGSEQNSDQFYQVLLGLNKIESKTVPAELSKAIFDVEQAFQLIKYGNDEFMFEVFIGSYPEQTPPRSSRGLIEHTCLEVDAIEAFLDACAQGGVEIRKIPKPGGHIVFIKDFDGNLFEIKEKM